MDLRDITHEIDLMVTVTTLVDGNLTRGKIDAALVDNGYTLPLENKVSFHLVDLLGADRIWLVTWSPSMNKYAVVKLNLK